MAQTEEAMTSLPNAPQVAISHRHAFGIRPDVLNGVHYVEESQLIYVCGHNTVLYNSDHRSQKFFYGSVDSKKITCLAMSASNRYLAVGEAGDHASATIWDLVKNEKKRTIVLPEADTTEFVWMDFSVETKQLLTLGNGPDWHLTLWNWEKGRVVASTKVQVPAGASLHSCSINPSDANVVVVVGDGVLMGYRLTESTLKPISGYGLSHSQQQQQQHGYGANSDSGALARYYRHCWLADDSLLVATAEGKLLLFDNCGEYRTTIPSSPTEFGGAPGCVVEVSRGFLVGVGDSVLVYEKSDDPKEVYRRAATLPVSVGGFAGLGDVVSVAVAPSEDFIAVQTSGGQLVQLPLSSVDALRAEDAVGTFVVAPFHVGPVNSVSCTVRKPLAVTCGSDKTVRVWNLEDRTLDLLHHFPEEPLCVSFHPGGYLIVAGFADKIRVLSVQMRSLHVVQEIPIKACRDVKFSPGGQYFAAASGTTVHVFHTFQAGQVVPPLRYHSNRVTALAWLSDDTTLVSVGLDGGVVEYDIRADGKRCSEAVTKGSKFSSAAVYRDLANGRCSTIAAGADRVLKEFAASKPTNVIDCGGAAVGQVCLANNGHALFGGVSDEAAPGSIQVHRFPVPGEFQTTTAHHGPCNRLVVSFDDSTLVSVGQDGSLYIFDARERDASLTRTAEGGQADGATLAKRERDLIPFAEEVLVTMSALEEQTALALEYERKVEERTTTREFELRRRDTRHKEDLMQLEFSFGQDVEQERTKLELLREEKGDLELAMEERLRQLEAEHADLISSREADFQQRMTDEVSRCAQLQRTRQKEEEEHKARMEALQLKFVSRLESLKSEMAESEKDSVSRMKALEQQASLRDRTHEETRRQLEADANKELVELANDYKDMVLQERNERNRHFCAAGTHRKGNDDLKREYDKSLEHLRQHEELLDTLKKEHRKLYNEKVSLARRIEEHNNAIGLKEQRMFELKRQNQELEKFRYVLDHKIKELRAQIDPKAAELARMQRHVLLIDSLLESFHRKGSQLSEKEAELDSQRQELEKLVVDLRTRVSRNRGLIHEMRSDIYTCAEVILDPPRLREAVRAIEARHLHGVDPPPPAFASDVRKETIRHRQYLEKAVAALRRKLAHDREVHKEDTQKIIFGNGGMIFEIAYYRKQIDDLKDKQSRNANKRIEEKHRRLVQEQRRHLAEKTATAARTAAAASAAAPEGIDVTAPGLGLMF